MLKTMRKRSRSYF